MEYKIIYQNLAQFQSDCNVICHESECGKHVELLKCLLTETFYQRLAYKILPVLKLLQKNNGTKEMPLVFYLYLNNKTGGITIFVFQIRARLKNEIIHFKFSYTGIL